MAMRAGSRVLVLAAVLSLAGASCGGDSALVSLSASPAEDGAAVVGLFAGEQREGFATC